MKDAIAENKYVELKYRVIDEKTQEPLVCVDFPIPYIHGHNDILSPEIMRMLEGHTAGEEIDVPIDCNKLYGDRDESLVFTDAIENVPEEYREVGTTITMENDKGETKNFIVTRVDENSVTVDGNNPLCGRKVIFKLEILTVRDATDEEIENGGKSEDEPDIPDINGTMRPV